MADVNTVALSGNLARDVQYFDNAKVNVARLTLAVSAGRRTAFVPVVCFGDSADAVKGMKRGNRLSVRGSINTGSYAGKNGDPVYFVEVRADEVIPRGEDAVDVMPF